MASLRILNSPKCYSLRLCAASVRNVKSDVLEFLKIAQRLRVPRTTVSKCIAVLEAEEKIVYRRVGRAEICRARV